MRLAGLLRLGASTALVIAAGALMAAEDVASERKRIAIERTAIEQRFEADQAECARRFAVNACMEGARQNRREALSPLRQQELLLSDAERKQRAADRAKAIERNRVEADARALAPAPMASAVRVRSSLTPASAPPRERSASGPRLGADKAAERATETGRRRQEAESDRERVRLRVERRAAEGKKVVPLPPPEAMP